MEMDLINETQGVVRLIGDIIKKRLQQRKFRDLYPKNKKQ